jgi:hypothetical protein
MCPDEQALRHEVAARVGYDPFFAWAKRTIVASVTRRGGAFVATVDMVDDDGVSHGARELRTEGECRELLDAVALAIAMEACAGSLFGSMGWRREDLSWYPPYRRCPPLRTSRRPVRAC